jgi:energy-coupling factor transporter ATP-binding protein EcfA2
MESKKHYTALSAKNLHFRHSTEERPQVSGVSFVIRAGRTLGVLGRNECGKTTLAQLLLGNLRPDVGEVLVHGNALADNGSGPSAAMPFVRILLLFSLTAGYTLPALPDTWMVIACRAGAFGVAIVLICIEVGRMLRARLDANNRADRLGWAPAQARAAGVAYISSEHDAGQRLDPNLSIEEAIGREMPIKAKAGRRREVLAALGASGFQMYTDNGKPTGDPETYLNDGVTMGQCSGGELLFQEWPGQGKHLDCVSKCIPTTANRRGALMSIWQLGLHWGSALKVIVFGLPNSLARAKRLALHMVLESIISAPSWDLTSWRTCMMESPSGSALEVSCFSYT